MLVFSDPETKGNTTFASPEDGRTFSQRIRESFEAERAAYDEKRARNIAEGNADFAALQKVARAAWDQQTYIENTTGREALLETSIDRVREAVKRSSGIDMENPFRGGYRAQADLELEAQFGGSWKRELERNPALRLNQQVNEFERALSEYAAGNPAVADAIAVAKIDFAPAMMARRINQDMESAMSEAPNFGAALAASVAGGLIPSLKDPVNVAGMAIGGGMPSRASSVGMRILETAGREAAINATITAAQQPFVQANRRELGLSAGFDEAAQNVGMAALFGAVIGSGVQGGRELVDRIQAGRATAADIDQALKAAGVKLDPEARTVLDQAMKSEAADKITAAEIPPGVPPEIADDVIRQAVPFVEDPTRNPPPDLPLVMPAPRPDRQAVVTEALPAVSGDRQTVDGKPVTFERFKPGELTTDALAMQYKGNSDAAGVTDRLRDVRQWDPLAGGRVFVLERVTGERVIADGHQRLGLARRLEQEGQANIELVGHLFREADGWTVPDVRALAARKNMQEGSGTALDAARVLRDRPDLADGGLPGTGPMMRNALALARLSDEAFALVNAGVVPEAYGARVGAMVANPLEHDAIMRDLVRFKPDSEREASILIGESMRAGFAVEHQIDMFGAMESRVSLMAERVRILNDSVKALANDRRLFQTLEGKAGRITEAGNVLAADNAAIAQSAAELQQIVIKLAQRSGPVSDALTAAARAMKDGAKPKEAVDQFIAQARTMIERDGLPALLADPELRVAKPVEPGSREALEAAESIELRDTQTMDMFGDPAPAPDPVAAPARLDLAEALPLPSRDDPNGIRLASREEALAESDQLGFAADLIQACKA